MYADCELAPCETRGLAFEIADLLLIQAVADARGFRVAVEIDHHSESDEMEEVLALYHGSGETCRCLIWRNQDAVVVQPIPGRARRFGRLSDALEWLEPEADDAFGDIACHGVAGTAAVWPDAVIAGGW